VFHHAGDHLERIFDFAVASKKPWMLLMPQYVARKAFYLEWLNHRRLKCGACKPVFLGPTLKPYDFQAPASKPEVLQMRKPGCMGNVESVLTNAAESRMQCEECCTDSSFKVAAGSFQCVWFLSLGGIPQQAAAVEWWQKNVAGEGAECVVVSDVKELPRLMAAPEATPAERRWKKKLATQQPEGVVPLAEVSAGTEKDGLLCQQQGRRPSRPSRHSVALKEPVLSSRPLPSGLGKSR
jgi:hypothetical protein